MEFWWNNSTGVDQQPFNVMSLDRQIPGQGLQTNADLEGWSERLYGPGCWLDAPGGALRPTVDVDASARTASVDHDRVLVLGRRLATVARLHRTEVQGPSRTDGGSFRDCRIIEHQEQLKQQRRAQKDRERWCHLVRITPTTRWQLESSFRFISLMLLMLVLVTSWLSASVRDRRPHAERAAHYELRSSIPAASPSIVLLWGSLARWCGFNGHSS